MSQSIKPPRVLFVRPKSAGSVRSRSQISSALAPTSGPTERRPSAPSAPPIVLTGVAPSQPVRPLGNSGRRPSSAVGSRRCYTTASACPLPRNHDVEGPCTWGQDVVDPEISSETSRENIYRVVVARKDAEDAAQQLARRIAHFRAQEERALRDMQAMRTRLETTLTKTQIQPDPSDSDMLEANRALTSLRIASRPLSLQGHHTVATDRDVPLNLGTNPTKALSSERRRRLKVPRSREQLEFLAKQKHALEVHRIEAARQQKERRKIALSEQKAKEAELEHKRRCRKERIRAEEQQVIEQRLEKQRQQREATSKQQYQRLSTEKQRQHEALNLIAIMEEEERNLRLRLEALHFHREYMKQELSNGLPASARRGMIDDDTISR